RRLDVQQAGDVHDPRIALLLHELVDALEVVLHARRGHGRPHYITRTLVAYITARPAVKPATFGQVSASPLARSICDPIAQQTWRIAPAPIERNRTAQRVEYVNAPIHAPMIVGTPAIAP